LWSLGVEEQFYLFWPWLLILNLGRNVESLRLFKILLIPLVAAPIFRMMGCKHWFPEQWGFLFQGFSFICCFDILAYGCLTAMLLFFWQADVELFFLKYHRFIAWAAAVSHEFLKTPTWANVFRLVSTFAF